jgi:hypothetical protein
LSQKAKRVKRQSKLTNSEESTESHCQRIFEKSYKTTGATFGLPSAQEKLGRNWNNFFQSMYQELK